MKHLDLLLTFVFALSSSAFALDVLEFMPAPQRKIVAKLFGSPSTPLTIQTSTCSIRPGRIGITKWRTISATGAIASAKLITIAVVEYEPNCSLMFGQVRYLDRLDKESAPFFVLLGRVVIAGNDVSVTYPLENSTPQEQTQALIETLLKTNDELLNTPQSIVMTSGR